MTETQESFFNLSLMSLVGKSSLHIGGVISYIFFSSFLNISPEYFPNNELQYWLGNEDDQFLLFFIRLEDLKVFCRKLERRIIEKNFQKNCIISVC